MDALLKNCAAIFLNSIYAKIRQKNQFRVDKFLSNMVVILSKSDAISAETDF